MKQLILTCAILMASIFSTFQASAEDMNIHQNNWRLGGSVGYASSTAGISGSYANIAPFAEYFVFDRFAVGLDASVILSSGSSATDFGPVVTYYFATCGKWAFSGQEEVLFYSNSYYGSSQNVSNTRIGADYFITPSVSFGPNLTYSVYLSPNSYSGSNTLTILGSFSIFL